VPEAREAEAIAGCLKRCLDFAERDQVYLAVDNHGYVTNDPDKEVEIFERVDSPYVGATMDTANFRWAGYSIEECCRAYDLVAPYVLHTHFKDCVGSGSEYDSTVLGEGEVDLEYAVAVLKKANYTGVYCAEWEGREGDGGLAYADCLKWMKDHVS
jgi:sugar phosphate isomerase/epimerase